MLIISSAEFDAFFLGGYQECFSVGFLLVMAPGICTFGL